MLISCIMAASIMPSQAQTYTPWNKGAMETGRYRNVFVEMGYGAKEVEEKVEEVFHDVFYGPNKVYFEVGDSMG